MADPISIAGTAVGVVSLGIQVCHELVDYLGAVREQRKQINDARVQVQTLRAVFSSLNTSLPHIQVHHPEDATLLQQCLQQCEGKLAETRVFLNKLKGPPTPSPVQEAGRTLVYPFRRAKLVALRSMLHDAQQCLQLVLQITSL
ncbi:hypothetical protein GQ53DRAFT_739496 [Thozetella sp. PMI_491]|nr:hypothetical protein GQ53DRAFT_739496 [Thozetella sp. PMI_491]